MIRNSATRNILVPLFSASGAPPNSDYYPYLDLNAIKARFQKREVDLFKDLGLAPLPLLEMAGQVRPDFQLLSERDQFSRSRAASAAKGIYRMLTQGDVSVNPPIREDLYLAVRNIQLLDGQCTGAVAIDDWSRAWHQVATVSLPFLNQSEAVELVNMANRPACWSSNPVLSQAWSGLYLALAQRNAGAMATHGLAILEHPRPLASIEQYDFVLGSALLGLAQEGRTNEARALFERHVAAPGSRTIPYPTYLMTIIHLATAAGTR
jgi:hypothetical protein